MKGGPSHTTIFIEELPNVNVTSWTFGEKVPVEIFTVPSIHNPTFFIYFSHAGADNWDFSIDVETSNDKGPKTALIKMGFAGHFLHGDNQVTDDLRVLEKALPPWIVPARWSATYDEYYF